MSQLKYADFTDIISDLNNYKVDTILVVIDHNLWNFYQENLNLEENLKDKNVITWKAPDGEKVKTFSEMESCLEFFISKGVHRKCHLVAIGGGSTTDFAGFIASVLVRGITWSSIPTTLLGMIDASIGGKTGINSQYGKNLIGSFHLPQNIWLNKKFLETLPDNEYRSGKGELLKYAFLSKEIYDEVSKSNFSLDKAIELSAKYKLQITEEDYKESGLRKILNLGHTIGHAVEKIYELTHGEAVLWGMAIIFIISDQENLIKDLKRVKNNVGWDLDDPPWLNKEFPIAKVMDYVTKDKKITKIGKVDLILIEEIGSPLIQSTSFKDLEQKLEAKKDDIKKFTFSNHA